MKNLKIIALAVFATAAVSAQDLAMNNVPENLSNSFQQAYPKATGVEWEMEGMNYKVEFDIGKMDHEIWYSKDGNILKIEMEITKNDLPIALSNALNNKYPKYKVDEVEVTEENDKKTYEVELEKGWNKEKKVVFDLNGRVLNEIND